MATSALNATLITSVIKLPKIVISIQDNAFYSSTIIFMLQVNSILLHISYTRIIFKRLLINNSVTVTHSTVMWFP